MPIRKAQQVMSVSLEDPSDIELYPSLNKAADALIGKVVHSDRRTLLTKHIRAGRPLVGRIFTVVEDAVISQMDESEQVYEPDESHETDHAKTETGVNIESENVETLAKSVKMSPSKFSAVSLASTTPIPTTTSIPIPTTLAGNKARNLQGDVLVSIMELLKVCAEKEIINPQELERLILNIMYRSVI